MKNIADVSHQCIPPAPNSPGQDLALSSLEQKSIGFKIIAKK
jgi:hypothetical protein